MHKHILHIRHFICLMQLFKTLIKNASEGVCASAKFVLCINLKSYSVFYSEIESNALQSWNESGSLGIVMHSWVTYIICWVSKLFEKILEFQDWKRLRNIYKKENFKPEIKPMIENLQDELYKLENKYAK